MEKALNIILFHKTGIRREIHDNEWWFSVVDVCQALTDSPDGGAYWRKLKQRLIEDGSEVVTFCHGLKLTASDGKKYETDCANLGEIAGTAKKSLEKKLGRSLTSSRNFKDQNSNKKLP